MFDPIAAICDVYGAEEDIYDVLLDCQKAALLQNRLPTLNFDLPEICPILFHKGIQSCVSPLFPMVLCYCGTLGMIEYPSRIPLS